MRSLSWRIESLEDESSCLALLGDLVALDSQELLDCTSAAALSCCLSLDARLVSGRGCGVAYTSSSC